LGVGGKIEHDGEEYVFAERKTEAVPYMLPSFTFQMIRRERDGIEAALMTIHKLVLLERGLPHPSYPKFRAPMNRLWLLWLLLIALGGTLFGVIVLLALPFLWLFGLLRDALEDSRIIRRRPVSRGMSDEEAMRLARKRDF
ncbi:hypothetical protein GR268_43605, partial [Rhizobium leguminosarum]|nr:hypothetical protein [Rhizobium leguminosarum]